MMTYARPQVTQAGRYLRRASALDELREQVRNALLAWEAAYHAAEQLAIPAVESPLLNAIARAHHAEFVLRAAQE